jgi:hypothetical protein
MRNRGLVRGAAMLVLGALFTYGLATALQQWAVAEARATASSAAPVAAAHEAKRTDAEWSF